MTRMRLIFRDPPPDFERKVEEFRELRKQAGRTIDPETAEVCWWFGDDNDPYYLGLVEGGDESVGRQHFARAPGKDNLWVWFGDLPEATVDALFKKHEANLFFPSNSVRYWPSFYAMKDSRPDLTEEEIIAELLKPVGN